MGHPYKYVSNQAGFDIMLSNLTVDAEAGVFYRKKWRRAVKPAVHKNFIGIRTVVGGVMYEAQASRLMAYALYGDKFFALNGIVTHRDGDHSNYSRRNLRLLYKDKDNLDDEIRRLYATTQYSQKEIAKMLRVDLRRVNRAVKELSAQGVKKAYKQRKVKIPKGDMRQQKVKDLNSDRLKKRYTQIMVAVEKSKQRQPKLTMKQHYDIVSKELGYDRKLIEGYLANYRQKLKREEEKKNNG